MKHNRRHVVVAMSGGVDSSVSAALLRQRYERVIGVTLDLAGDAAAPRLASAADDAESASCGDPSAVASARAVAQHLGIEHVVIDRAHAFEHEILRHAWQAYDHGETPNPCVRCNQRIKFAALAEVANLHEAHWIATGHYARFAKTSPRILRRGLNSDKDQSYFLFAVEPAHLARTIFPVGDLHKSAVRTLAHEFALSSAERAESQDACIVLTGDTFAETLRTRFAERAQPGTFVDENGTVLGQHQGIHQFTVGQRKGLGIALGERAYVVAIRADTRQVVLSTAPERLLARGLVAAPLCFQVAPADLLRGTFPELPRAQATSDGFSLRVQVQVRYRHRAVPGTLDWLQAENRARVHFDSPQRAVTPGQAAVFYHEDLVLGGGWITSALDCDP